MAVEVNVHDESDRRQNGEPLEGNYFVACYPPFSCWNQAQLGRVRGILNASKGSRDDATLGLYVHIPFCAERCRYCYYLSYANRPTHEIERYIDAVVAEATRYANATRLAGRRPAFVYFGGGTPSLLTPEQLRRLTRSLQAAFDWTDAQEVTCECAPRTVTPEKLDDRFAYDPAASPVAESPARTNLLRDRLAVLWDLYIDARLAPRGFLDDGRRNDHAVRLAKTFQRTGPDDAELKRTVVRLWRADPLVYADLVRWATAYQTMFETSADGPHPDHAIPPSTRFAYP